jgi:hypothetical protein
MIDSFKNPQEPKKIIGELGQYYETLWKVSCHRITNYYSPYFDSFLKEKHLLSEEMC